jgi:hypothetical protein
MPHILCSKCLGQVGSDADYCSCQDNIYTNLCHLCEQHEEVDFGYLPFFDKLSCFRYDDIKKDFSKFLLVEVSFDYFFNCPPHSIDEIYSNKFYLNFFIYKHMRTYIIKDSFSTFSEFFKPNLICFNSKDEIINGSKDCPLNLSLQRKIDTTMENNLKILVNAYSSDLETFKWSYPGSSSDANILHVLFLYLYSLLQIKQSNLTRIRERKIISIKLDYMKDERADEYFITKSFLFDASKQKSDFWTSFILPGTCFKLIERSTNSLVYKECNIDEALDTIKFKMHNSLATLPDEEEINIFQKYWYSRDFEFWPKIIATKLTILNLSYIPLGENPRMIDELSFYFIQNENLENLYLSSCKLNPYCIKILFEKLDVSVKNYKLKVLDISNNTLGSEGIQKLKPLFVKCGLIEKLNLSLCSLEDNDKSDYEILFSFLDNLKNLNFVNISFNSISFKGLCSINKFTTRRPFMENNIIAENMVYCHKNSVETGVIGRNHFELQSFSTQKIT